MSLLLDCPFKGLSHRIYENGRWKILDVWNRGPSPHLVLKFLERNIATRTRTELSSTHSIIIPPSPSQTPMNSSLCASVSERLDTSAGSRSSRRKLKKARQNQRLYAAARAVPLDSTRFSQLTPQEATISRPGSGEDHSRQGIQCALISPRDGQAHELAASGIIVDWELVEPSEAKPAAANDAQEELLGDAWTLV